MDAAALTEYRRRWEMFVEREIDELRRQSLGLRLAQTFSLMALGIAMGFVRRTDEPEIEGVRARWVSLKGGIPR